MLLDVLLPVVPCPLASCLRPLALPQGPLPLLPSLMVFRNRLLYMCCLLSFLPQLVFLCRAMKMASYVQTQDRRARPLFFPPLPLQIEESHGWTMVGQSWLLCLLMSGLIMLARGVSANSSKTFLPSCGWQPFQNHREIGTNVGQKRNNSCSLCDYYSSILCMKKLRPKILNKFPSRNLSSVN